MQTNGTLVTEAVADFLQQIGLRPSVSLDGPPHVHDLMRQQAERTLEGIRRLVDRDLTPTVLVVMGPHNVWRIDEVVDFLLAMGLRRTRFNVYQSAGRAATLGQVWPSDLAEARFRLVQRVLDGDLLDANVARLLHLAASVGDPRPDDYRSCGAFHCGGGIRHVAVGPDGRLYPCDRCQAEAICELGSVGAPLEAAEVARRVAGFHGRFQLARTCLSCPARRTCHACCTAYRGSRADVTALCRASRLLQPKLESAMARIRVWVSQHPLSEFAPRRGPRPLSGRPTSAS